MRICRKILLLAAFAAACWVGTTDAEVLCRKKMPITSLSSSCDAGGVVKCSVNGTVVSTSGGGDDCAEKDTICTARARWACTTSGSSGSAPSYPTESESVAGQNCWCGNKYYHTYATSCATRCPAVCPQQYPYTNP